MRRSSKAIALLALLWAPALAAQELPVAQGEAEYSAWLAGDPAARGAILSFEAWLEAAGVAHILPTWQITRTASMWAVCAGPPFQVAPPELWPHVAGTLRYIRAHVVPVVGPVEAVSGYRNPELNICARGSPESAHRHFFALDMIPLRPIGREAMIASLCAIHDRRGPEYGIGLGFYSFLRFHVDSRSFRRWGPDGRGESSPCNVLGDSPPAAGAGTSRSG